MILGHGHHIVDLRKLEQAVDQHQAARLAAREAFLKALGMTQAGDLLIKAIDPNEIEVTRQAGERPRVILSGRAKTTAAQQGIDRIHVSLSHDGPYAAAVVILESAAGDN